LSERKLGRKRVEPARWHAYIATPAYDGRVTTDFAQSLAEASFCSPLYMVQVSAGVLGNGAFIELARNIFVKLFLEEHKDCTHLFFIDADLKFPPNAFVGLMRSGQPICAGVYRRREETESYPAVWSQHPTEGGLWVEDDWIMHDRVPTGFLCISRKVIEEMVADAPLVDIPGQKGGVPWLFYTKRTEDKFIGEDFAFCDDYRKKYGKPIPVWPDIDFSHNGFKGNYLDYLKRKVDELPDPVGTMAELEKPTQSAA
jgi:hypothetical protein